MKLSSPEFTERATIPSTYAQSGENIHPPLRIEDVPEGTACLVLIVDDPDAATDPDGPGHTFTHWVVYDMPVVETLPEGVLPEEAKEGVNSTGETGWVGMAPPNGEHRYLFTLYALEHALDLPEGADKVAVEDAMRHRIIEQTQLIGVYSED